MALCYVLLLTIIAMVQSSPSIRPQTDVQLTDTEDYTREQRAIEEDEMLERQGRANAGMGKSVCTQAGGSCGHPNEARCCKGRCSEGRCPVPAVSKGKTAGGWR